MSFLDSFFEGASGGAAQYFSKEADAYRNEEADAAKSAREEERAIRMAKINEELAVQKEQAVQYIRRAMNIQAGQDISAEADRIGTRRVDANMEANNPVADKSTWTPEQEAARNQGKQSLLDTMTRSDRLRDMADGAMNKGYIPEANAMRTQLTTELTGERQEKANELGLKNAELKERDIKRKEADDKSDREMAEKRLTAMLKKQSGGNKEEKILGVIDSQRKDLTAQVHSLDTRYNRSMDEISREYRDSLKDPMIDKAEAKSTYLAQKAEVEKRFEPEREALSKKQKASDYLYEVALQRTGVTLPGKGEEQQKSYGGYPVQTTETQNASRQKTAPVGPATYSQKDDADAVLIFQKEVLETQKIINDPKSSPSEVERAKRDLAGLNKEMNRLGIVDAPPTDRLSQFKVIRR